MTCGRLLCHRLLRALGDRTTAATVAFMLITLVTATAGASTRISIAAASSTAAAAVPATGVAELEHSPRIPFVVELAEAGSCGAGCSLCSDINGCLQCKPAYYLILVRDYMLQRGTCSRTCPSGYYPSDRDASVGPLAAIKKCLRCNLKNCETCYNRQFCTRCHQPYVIFRGHCYDTCNTESTSANTATECSQAECLMGPWSQWSNCTSRHDDECISASFRQNSSGVQYRSREILMQSSAMSTSGRCMTQVSEQQNCQLSTEVCYSKGRDRATKNLTISRHGSDTARKEYKVHKRRIRPAVKPQHLCTRVAKGDIGETCLHLRLGSVRSDDTQAALLNSQTRSVGMQAESDKITPVPLTEITTSRQSSSLVHVKHELWAAATVRPVEIPVMAADLKPVSEDRRQSSIAASVDVFSSDYYGYYMRLAKQLLTERSERNGS